mmetsp:Transcript_10717/g.20340  ORF Transcript_10717/g.20340 Transcript_10717/m.20340 type:complete len:82 (+) Transcript_10717:195-440(+)
MSELQLSFFSLLPAESGVSGLDLRETKRLEVEMGVDSRKGALPELAEKAGLLLVEAAVMDFAGDRKRAEGDVVAVARRKDE